MTVSRTMAMTTGERREHTMSSKPSNTAKKLRPKASGVPYKPGPEWRGNAAGRPKGSRNKLSAEFIAAMCTDFEKHGPAVIAKVRDEKPEAYLRVIASLVPHQVELGEAGAFSDLTDDQLDAFINSCSTELAKINGKGMH